jgi:hypothetical protein
MRSTPADRDAPARDAGAKGEVAARIYSAALRVKPATGRGLTVIGTPCRPGLLVHAAGAHR